MGRTSLDLSHSADTLHGMNVSNTCTTIEAARAAQHARVDAAFDHAEAVASDDADHPRYAVAESVAAAVAAASVADHARGRAALAVLDVTRRGGVDGLLRLRIADELVDAGWASWDARRFERHARRLAWLPKITNLLDRGRLSWAAVSSICDQAQPLSVAETDALDTAIAEWIDARQGVVIADDVIRAVETAVDQILPNRRERDERATHDARFISVQQSLTGGASLYGQLDAEVAATIVAALDAAATDHTPEDGGDPQSWKTRGRARADGLHTVADHYLAGATCPTSDEHAATTDSGGDDPDATANADPDDDATSDATTPTAGWRHAARPSVTVTVPLARLTDPAIGTHRPDRTDPSDLVPGHITSSLARAVAISDPTARRLACDADLRTIVTDGDTPIGIGRTTRVVPTWLRDAVAARDAGCRWPGCDHSPAGTHIHHVWHWADGGPTDLDNLVTLCARHHRTIHHTTWQLTLHPDATVTVRRGHRRRTSHPPTRQATNITGLPPHRPAGQRRLDLDRAPPGTHTNAARTGQVRTGDWRSSRPSADPPPTPDPPDPPGEPLPF